jgi:pilus assembly protein CpaE
MLDIKTKFINPESKKQFRSTVRPLKDFRIIDDHASGQADVLVYELGDSADLDFEVIQADMENARVRHVLLVSADTSREILMGAIRLGVREFLTPPLDAAQVHAALAKIQSMDDKQGETHKSRQGRIINVLGSKGGVGTTTIAVNLAMALTTGKQRSSVALVDMNTLFGDIPLFLDLKTEFHWGEITKNIDRMDNIFLGKILAKHPSGIDVLPSPAYLNGHIAPTPETIEHILDVMQAMFDFIVIDAGQSTNDTCLKIIQMASDVLLVSTLSLPCLSNANKLLQSLSDLGYAGRDKMKVLLNRYLKKGEISLKEAEQGISQNFFWKVPNDYKSTMSAINQGQPLQSLYPKAAVTRSIDEMAQALRSGVDGHPPEKKRRSFFFKRS